MDLGKINRTMIDGGMAKPECESINKQLHYIGFVWEGKFCNDLVKAGTINKAFELEQYMAPVSNKFMEVMFSGAVYQKGSVRAGTILQLVNNKNNRYSEDDLKMIKLARRKNLLLKMLIGTKKPDTVREGLRLMDDFKKASGKFGMVTQESEPYINVPNLTPNKVPGRGQKKSGLKIVSRQKADTGRKRGLPPTEAIGKHIFPPFFD
jgi:hypothetical protein